MLGHRIFPRPLFSASHGSVAKWGKQTNTQNCKQGTEATFMVFGVLKVSWCFQFLVAGRNQQKNICFTNLYIYRRYFWPYYYTANVAPHRCMVAPHRCMIVYRSIRGHCFFDPPSCLFDFPRVFLIPHERNRKWNSKETLKKLTWMFARYFWPYYYTANVAPHRCMVAPHRCMIVYRSIWRRSFLWSPTLFVWPPPCFFDQSWTKSEMKL